MQGCTGEPRQRPGSRLLYVSQILLNRQNELRAWRCGRAAPSSCDRLALGFDEPV